jgi:hypothetical protein
MARTAGRQGFVSFVPIVATPAASAANTSEDAAEPDESGSKLETAENK